MTKMSNQMAELDLSEAFAAFERQHPEVAEAMKVMNISLPDYLQAMAAIREIPSTSGNASTTP